MSLPLPEFAYRNPIVRRLIAPAVVLGVTGLVAMVALDMRERRSLLMDASAESHIERINGPPCPTLTAQAFRARQLAANVTFDFGGLTFARQSGHVECSQAASGAMLGTGSYPVCQFARPWVLAVRQGRSLYLFEPGVGRDASIIARDGKIACVLSAPYWAA
jgi:hypothetical protein